VASQAQPTTTLAELQSLIARFRDDRDWSQFHKLKDLAAAIAIEAGELQQEFLWLKPDEETLRLSDRRDEIANELADILILALSFADQAGIDPAAAIQRKLQVNAEKYPVEKARGSATKYSELP
jgi:dCTP diphosphatase